MNRLILSLMIASAALSPAAADDMTFFMKNSHARAVVVELKSRSRDQVWPGGGKVYLLELGEKKSVTVACEAGERICYAAWVNGDAGQSWGIGPDDDRTCDTCCRTCVGGTTETLDIGG